jgi:tetratricopeptide (TPR) repeat protein
VALNEGSDRDGMTPADGVRLPAGCPDAERLAEYAEGLLDAPARAAIEAHLITCADCRFAIVETMAFLGEEAAKAGGAAPETPAVALIAEPDTLPAADAPATPEVWGQAVGEPAGRSTSTSTGAPAQVVVPFRKRSWMTGVAATLAVAATLVLIVRIAAPDLMPSWPGGGPPLEGLAAALENQRVRPLEGRLMGGGGFPYAPAPSPPRGPLKREWSPDVGVATANIEKFAEGNTSARARAALGVALIVEGELDTAITTLEQAAKDLPDDPAVHANLSAAYSARASWWNRHEDWPKALDAAERAIRLDPSALEPYFNRALALEGLRQWRRAAQAWNEYASRDRDSAWTREAEDKRKTALTSEP